MKKFIHIFFIFVITSHLFGKSQSPNFVFILIDDMGISDIGVNGAKFYETPNIDKLISDGMNFTNAYTSISICAPARASSMTGKHPLKLGMWNHYHHMPSDSKTVATYLKEVGYTTWHVGKWHCGSPLNKTLPQDVGFDINIAGWEAWAPASYFYPYKLKNKKTPTRNRVPDLEKGGKDGEYLTDRITDEAIKLIKGHDMKSPFYLNMWHFAVHTPLQAKADKIEKYKKKAIEFGKDMPMKFLQDEKGTNYFENPLMGSNTKYKDACITYAAMIESLDENIGKLIQALKDKGVYENTMIIFYSDNGPLTDRLIMTPYRGGKNSTYQGGVRIPAAIVWKGKVHEGGFCDSQINIYDIPYTVLDAAGARQPEGGDGKSLIPILTGKEKSISNREFFWYFPSTRMHWGQYASAAYKDKENWKYQMKFNGDEDELYDLNSDKKESNNLINKYPERAKIMEKRLRDELNKYYKNMPKPDEIYIDNVERRLRGESAIRVKDKNY